MFCICLRCTLCDWLFFFFNYFDSAGIGRTGVLITMETALSLLDKGRPVFPLDIVKTLRDQRAMMVQTTVQRNPCCWDKPAIVPQCRPKLFVFPKSFAPNNVTQVRYEDVSRISLVSVTIPLLIEKKWRQSDGYQGTGWKPRSDTSSVSIKGRLLFLITLQPWTCLSAPAAAAAIITPPPLSEQRQLIPSPLVGENAPFGCHS